MWLAVIVIGVISAVVIGGTAFLAVSKGEELPQAHKVKIMLVVGVVVFVSFVITTFKHRDLRIGRQNTEGIDVEKVFFGVNGGFHNPPRHSTLQDIPREHLSELHRRNYINAKESPHPFPERILFLSSKDQGASTFLANLATQLSRDERHPVVYLKLQEAVMGQQKLAELVGVPSYDQLQRALCYLGGWQVRRTMYGVEYHKQEDFKGKQPYLIVDNFQYMLNTLVANRRDGQNEEGMSEGQRREREAQRGYERVIVRVMTELMTGCGINVLLNTERQSSVEFLYQIWQELGRKEIFPFEYHRWEGLNQYDIYQIITKNIPESQNLLAKLLDHKKQSTYSFRDLSRVLEEARMQKQAAEGNVRVKVGGGDELGLAQVQTKLSVARYFGVQRALVELRRSDNRRVGWVKSRMPWTRVEKLQSLGLVDIRNGGVTVN